MPLKVKVVPQSERLHTFYRNKAYRRLMEVMLNCHGQDSKCILKVIEVQFPIIENYIKKSYGILDSEE